MTIQNGKIRLAIVHYQFGFGGAERMISDLVSALDMSLFSVTVICLYGDEMNNEMETKVRKAGAQIIFLRCKLHEKTQCIRRLGRYLTCFKPNIIHSHLGAVQYCLYWSLLNGVPIVHTIHNEPQMELSKHVMKPVMRFFFMRNQVIPIAISSYNRKLVSEYYGIARNRVCVVNNPVDIDFFHPSDSRMPAKYDFINVAGARVQKNQKLLLEAFSDYLNDHTEGKLCIVGDGEELVSLKYLADKLGITVNVDFRGQIEDRATLRNLLWASKAFVLSSDYEGLPLSVLEAMACGLPVISTSVGGLPDIVKNNGVLTRPQSRIDLAKAMNCLANCDLSKLGAASRVISERFSLVRCAESYSELYRKFAVC